MLLYEDVSKIILDSAYEVHRIIGTGFLEKVYENALKYELEIRGLKCEAQKAIEVYYKDITAGHYYADLVIDNKIIVELKSVSSLSSEHFAQLLNYLKGTGYRLGILINFGNSKLEFKRIVN